MIKSLIQRLVKPLDPWLVLMLLALLLVGQVTLFSAGDKSFARVEAQMLNFSVAFACMWVVASLPPQRLMNLAPPLYILGVLLLLGVFLFGDVSKGARRWLNLGVTRIQPSEMMKIALPMMLAWYMQKHESMLRARDFLVAALLLGLPVAFVLKQPDLGTSILIAGSGFFVLYLAGLSWKLILPMLIVGIVSIWFVTDVGRCTQVFHDYQCQRVQTLIDPTTDPLGKGYHTIQGTIAIGSGGLTGKGWLQGTQTHLDYIPEKTTDFVFAVYSEEFGLVGNVILLLIYFSILLRGLTITLHASSLFGKLLAGAITMTFFTYAFVNMGMVSGILPVVGVPLPLMSYGGTSLVTLCIGFGLLMSIHRHRALIRFGN
ncbi:rod shape-determining protein RodA [Leeia sp. TBRC 13508]|uniref:Peptidoglycan glycosyltransferase MrdB n=1 Tax=Leeia speluncae TaxID=2884804 RepID=A0ABS8D802_9NEIS|nr:rod shape-determining protein RodA [Leeia speluncae]MCB6184106.1 rod shape-determining protein RodA [Leeia speluncae]